MAATVKEIAENQHRFQTQYAHKWGGYSPERAARLLAWLYGELGEVGDIIKKQGNDKIMQDEAVRNHFIEELCDVMMYWHDVWLSFGIKPDEVEQIYRQKYMQRLAVEMDDTKWDCNNDGGFFSMKTQKNRGEITMADLTLQEMQEMQKTLQEKYFDKWGGLSPEIGVRTLLWLYGELGEVGDIIKKQGNDKIMNDDTVRTHFIEEMCDAMMYWNDLLLCYDIKPEDVEKVYREKFARNMKRW